MESNLWTATKRYWKDTEKDVEIIEAHAMPEYIHMLVQVLPKMSISSFMGYLKG